VHGLPQPGDDRRLVPGGGRAGGRGPDGLQVLHPRDPLGELQLRQSQLHGERAVGFPGAINNCEDCHTKGADSYYPVDDAKVFATTVWGGTAKGPQDDLAITPNVAACGACHTTTLAQEHMQQNGGVIVDPIYNGNYAAQVAAMGGSIKNADGSTKPQYQTETCTVCHGPGATADVKVVHSVASYQ
jgi:OmcA/MtrC family decaheme c-type cytochrome